jgi:bla regulator protein blaR1
MDTSSITSILMIALIKPLLLVIIISLLWLLLRKKSASLQHFVLSLGVVGILCLPLLASVLPVIEINFSASILSAMIERINYWVELSLLIIGSTEDQDKAKIIFVVVGIYLLVMSSLVFYFLIDIVTVVLETKSAATIKNTNINQQLEELCELFDIKRKIRLVSVEKLSSPQTWGFIKPVIMLPKNSNVWDEDKILSIFTHELAHIVRLDWLTTLVVKMACAVFWFLLPLWWMANKIYQQAEIACDDYIFKIREKNVSYAQTLLAIAKNDNSLNKITNTALSMRGHSPLYHRIIAILDKQRPHHAMPVEDAQYWVILGGFVLVMLAGIQLIPVVNQVASRSTPITHFDWDFPIEKSRELETNLQPFSWELLQELKKKNTELSQLIDKTEEIKVSVPRLTKGDLSALSKIEEDTVLNVEKPNIQMTGYFPIEIASPVYPQLAIERGIEGWVQVEFGIDTRGQVVKPQIVARSGSRVFDKAVLIAIKKSRYQPQVINGEPISLHGVTETFRFKLMKSDVDETILEKPRR